MDPAYEAQKAQYNAEEHALKANAKDSKAALDAIYGGMQAQMAPLAPAYMQQNAAIGQNLTSQLDAFAPAYGLGGGVAPVAGQTGGQGDAYANQLYGAIGASTLGLMANDANRVAGYGNMSQQQGAIEQMEAGRGAENDLQNRLTELSMARAGLVPDLADREGEAWDRNFQMRQFQAEQDQLAWERKQAKKSRSADNDALAKMIQAAMRGGNGNGGNGGGNDDKPGGGGQDEPKHDYIKTSRGTYGTKVQGVNPITGGPVSFPKSGESGDMSRKEKEAARMKAKGFVRKNGRWVKKLGGPTNLGGGGGGAKATPAPNAGKYSGERLPNPTGLTSVEPGTTKASDTKDYVQSMKSKGISPDRITQELWQAGVRYIVDGWGSKIPVSDWKKLNEYVHKYYATSEDFGFTP